MPTDAFLFHISEMKQFTIIQLCSYGCIYILFKFMNEMAIVDNHYEVISQTQIVRKFLSSLFPKVGCWQNLDGVEGGQFVQEDRAIVIP